MCLKKTTKVKIIHQKQTMLGLLELSDCLNMTKQRVMRTAAAKNLPEKLLLRFATAISMAANHRIE